MTTQQPENRALAIVPRTGIVLPAVDTDGAVAAWNAYVTLCKAVIGPEDVQKTWDGEFRKKSAFRKLARFYDLTDRVILSDVKRDERGRPIFAAFTVRATAPNGREAEGYHECHLSERCCAEAFGDPCDKKGKHKHCAANCSGWSHWSHPGDIPATAHTRAKNRAISDLIGAGEVSAEEVGDSGPDRDEAAPARAPAPERDSGVPCVTCGAETFAFKDGKMRGHKTGQKDAQSKDIWHRQPVAAEKPAEAPAPRPEAKTPPVVEGEVVKPGAKTEPLFDQGGELHDGNWQPKSWDVCYNAIEAQFRIGPTKAKALADEAGRGQTPQDMWAFHWQRWEASRAPTGKAG